VLSATSFDFAWKVIIETFSPIFNLLNKSFHDIFELCFHDYFLNTPHVTNMQMMKVNRRFKDQIQKSADRLFEIIELNVDEPIIFQRGSERSNYLKEKM